MRVRVVRPESLARLKDEPWVEGRRRPYVRDGIAYMPVRDGYDADLVLPDRRPYTGRGFSMIGTIALFEGEEPTKEQVRQVKEWKNPTGILWVRARNGVLRLPDIRVVSGESSVVRHREMGVVYWLDPSQVMFSRGNRQEKARMMGIIRKGERVADMFAGIGQFSLPLAYAGAKVHAMELNPVAYGYLCRNIEENGFSGQMTAECGDSRDLLFGWYDRIVMGHFDAQDLLSAATGHILPGGIIHLHSAFEGTPSLADQYQDSFVVEAIRRVKKVRPHTWHYVMDLRAT
ncbi:MAG: SAM-dependent methyltransferase [Methanoregulaceae archaeon]|nr:SAM-dependent methyltransferase [Methanoregulaceae archaeon]